MSDDSNKGFDFTDEEALKKWAQEFLAEREKYLAELNDEDFELNPIQYYKLLKLIEIFENIAKREVSQYDSELYHGVNVEIFPVELVPKEQSAVFTVELDGCFLSAAEIEVFRKAIEGDGSLEICTKTYGKTELNFLIHNVYIPKAQ